MFNQIVDAHGGKLPADVIPTFANTGKEMPETLDFVRDLELNFNAPITWIERDDEGGFRTVNHNSAARKGEPYSVLIDQKGYLPNPVTRFCTMELKIRPMRDLAKSFGWTEWTNVIGLRADEPRRVASARARSDSGKEQWLNAMPLAEAGVTVRTIGDFWAAQSFDLALPNVNGSTPLGNCDLCFLKSAKTIAGILRDRPALGEWWAEAEAEARASKPSGARFRSDRPSYAKLMQIAKDQGDFGFPAGETSLPCGCHD